MLKMGMLAATAFLAQPLYAADVADTVTLSVTGEGNWEMICHAILRGGDQVDRILGGDRNSYSGVGVRRLSCELKNNIKGPLVVHLVAPPASCPFKGAAEGACEKTFAKGAAGSFEMKIKGP